MRTLRLTDVKATMDHSEGVVRHPLNGCYCLLGSVEDRSWTGFAVRAASMIRAKSPKAETLLSLARLNPGWGYLTG